MRRLYTSIIISVLSALFLINWGVDKLATNSDDFNEHNDISLQRKLIEGFSIQLNKQPNINLIEATQQLATQFNVTLSIKETDSLAIPETIHPQLKQYGGLLLASDNNERLLKALNNHKNKLIELIVETHLEQPKNIDFILTTLLYLGVCFVILLWLFPLTRRLYLLTQTAEKIGQGQLSARLPKSRFSYISPFEEGFNRMAGQIEKLVADNKILARSLSHDIRTPLACLRFGVEAARDSKDIDKKNTYINRMDTEITRMEDMTTSFLEYASLERKGMTLNKEKTDLCALLKTLIGNFTALAEQHNIKISLHSAPLTAVANIDNHWVNIALQNIISNAMRYANTQVALDIKDTDKTIIISIDDDGEGIPTAQLEEIFHPFVKLDVDRSSEESHFGLGLATTGKVMEWHQATIEAKQSTKYSGLCFTLNFLKESK